MREHSQALMECIGVSIRHQPVALIGEFRDRIGDGIVEAAIERSKLINLDRDIVLEGQIGDGLAQIAVIVHHPVERVPMP